MDFDQIIINDFITKHPFAAAKALEALEPRDVAVFIQSLALQKSIKILSLMNPKHAAECFMLLPSKQKVEYMEKAEPPIIAAILKPIEEPVLSEFLRGISSDKALIIKRELDYRPNTIGPLAKTAITVHKTMTVAAAIELIKRSEKLKVSELYVVDLDGIFQGLVASKELVLSDRTALIESIMITKCPRFSADQPLTNILEDKAWLEYRYVPVIDRSEKLIGSLSYKTLMAITGKPKNKSKDSVNQTAGALGELYRIGLNSLLQSAGK